MFHKRFIKAVLAGAAAGLLLLACVFVPITISRNIATAHSASLQENLSISRGEAVAEYPVGQVHITALFNGAALDGASVSSDGYRWFTPQNGVLETELIPGVYEMTALFENRIVTGKYEAATGGETLQVVLDVGNAPAVSELIIFDVDRAEDLQTLPLNISNAHSVIADEMPNSVSVVQTEDSFALSLNLALLPYNFYHITLRAYNDSGQAEMHVGLRIAREAPITEICTVDDLAGISKNLSGSYLLMNNLDMSDVRDWNPIGSAEYPFSGVFDGNGYEISGFHSPDSIPEDSGFALFHTVRNAEIRNVIIREPNISPKDISASSGHAALAIDIRQSMIERCAVIDGRIAPSDGGACGLFVAGVDVVAIDLYNSADVFCNAANSALRNTGGIAGMFSGYGTRLINEGEVYGTHLTGGITGFLIDGYINHCVNSGYIWGQTFLGEYPCGGIVQSVAGQSTAADGYFVIGQSARGSGLGRVSSLIPVSPAEAERIIQEWDIIPKEGGLPSEAS